VAGVGKHKAAEDNNNNNNQPVHTRATQLPEGTEKKHPLGHPSQGSSSRKRKDMLEKNKNSNKSVQRKESSVKG